MNWWPVLALCASAYALKVLGLVVGERLDRETSERWSLEIVVVPVLAALIVIQTFTSGQRFVFDARTPALVVAAVLVWRKAPFVVVALAAAATAALLRLVA
jgi:branched-subunit amino acid transport protein